jgi:hypothetical protein
MTCPSCQTDMCFNHCVRWHNEQTCEQYQQKLEKAEAATEELVEKTAKYCPNESCKIIVTKVSGCDHMTCKWLNTQGFPSFATRRS